MAQPFVWGTLRVDFDAHCAWRAGVKVPLTPQEFALLETLIRSREQTLTRGQLLRLAWGYDCAGKSRTVDVHISRLRRKLGLSDAIRTVYKTGYRLSLSGAENGQ